MLSVKTDEATAANVRSILERHQPLDPTSLGEVYRKAGWKSYDPKAPAYALTDLEIERMRRP